MWLSNTCDKDVYWRQDILYFAKFVPNISELNSKYLIY